MFSSVYFSYFELKHTLLSCPKYFKHLRLYELRTNFVKFEINVIVMTIILNFYYKLKFFVVVVLPLTSAIATLTPISPPTCDPHSK